MRPLEEILEEQENTKEPLGFPVGSWWTNEFGEIVQVIDHIGGIPLCRDHNGIVYSAIGGSLKEM